jgi:hypothetical protein
MPTLWMASVLGPTRSVRNSIRCQPFTCVRLLAVSHMPQGKAGRSVSILPSVPLFKLSPIYGEGLCENGISPHKIF